MIYNYFLVKHILHSLLAWCEAWACLCKQRADNSDMEENKINNLVLFFWYKFKAIDKWRQNSYSKKLSFSDQLSEIRLFFHGKSDSDWELLNYSYFCFLLCTFLQFWLHPSFSSLVFLQGHSHEFPARGHSFACAGVQWEAAGVYQWHWEYSHGMAGGDPAGGKTHILQVYISVSSHSEGFGVCFNLICFVTVYIWSWWKLILFLFVYNAVTLAQSQSLCQRLHHRKRQIAGSGCPQSSVKLVAKDGEDDEMPLKHCGCTRWVI